MATASTTPLLLLLDSVLCQDREQLENAVNQVRHLKLPSRITLSNLSEVVEILLDDNPQNAFVPSEPDQSLPLHFAASIGNIKVAEVLYAKVSLTVVRSSSSSSLYIIPVSSCCVSPPRPRVQNPKAISAPNDKGKIPLHYAAREGRAEMVQFLLKNDPSTAQIRSNKDKLPLHFACGEGHFEVVRALLSIDPEGAERPSKKGKIALHFAARWGHIPVAQHLVQLYPHGVHVQDWEGSLPLHDAAREGQAVMSQLLIDQWSGALQTTNLRGEIPLFAGVRSGNLSIVVCLLGAWHQGGKHVLQNLTDNDSVEDWDWNILELCLRGAEGNFKGCPMMLNVRSRCACTHTACAAERATVESHETNGRKKRANASLSLSKKRLRLNDAPGVDLESCCCNFLPVNAALRADVNPRVLKTVLKESRQNLTQADCVGAFPIHIAVSHVKNKESIQVCLDELLKHHPQALQVRDNSNRLPLHKALLANADFAFVEALVEAHPKSVIETYQAPSTCCCGGAKKSKPKNPLALAIEQDCDLDTIFFLLQRDPTFLNQSLQAPGKSEV